VTTRPNRSGNYDVAFYVPWIGPLLTTADVRPTGGAETQIYLVARALAARGVRVCLIVFAIPGADIPSQIDGVDVIVRPPYKSQQRFVGKLREAANIRRALASVNARVIVTRAAGPHVGLAAIFAKLRRTRFVYSSANISDFDFGRLTPNRRDRVLFRLGIRLADEVIVQSDEQVTMCRRTFGKASVRIRSLAEPAAPRANPAEAFLWIGRLVWYKRPLAFVELARAMPEAEFWMVGVPVPHGAAGSVASEVAEASASVPNLRLLPPRRRPELMELVERAVAIVNTADFEGVPNIFLEGWTRGVPAVALTHDPDSLIMRNGLGAFADGSDERLVELTRELWAGRGNQQQLARRCREYIEAHHSPAAIAEAWIHALGVAPTSECDAFREAA
jgi:glycosyltransferase involved in cell wall biosynthesis